MLLSLTHCFGFLVKLRWLHILSNVLFLGWLFVFYIVIVRCSFILLLILRFLIGYVILLLVYFLFILFRVWCCRMTGLDGFCSNAYFGVFSNYYLLWDIFCFWFLTFVYSFIFFIFDRIVPNHYHLRLRIINIFWFFLVLFINLNHNFFLY